MKELAELHKRCITAKPFKKYRVVPRSLWIIASIQLDEHRRVVDLPVWVGEHGGFLLAGVEILPFDSALDLK